MKITQLVVGIFFSLSSAFAAETTISNVFIPPSGFDDNDQVVAMVQGTFLDGCSKKGSTIVERSGTFIRIRQEMIRAVLGACSNPETMPDYLKIPVPFTSEVDLGLLEAGTYTIEFLTESGVQTRTFLIEQAQVTSIDSRPYAAVTQFDVPDLLGADESLVVKLKGVLNSTCTDIEASDIKIEQFNDVVVILPVLKLRSDIRCLRSRIPFELNINLGRLLPGHHMIHVRSLDGHGLSRVIEVLPTRW
jgi:hypothetical protein